MIETPQYEVYVACGERTVALATRFLDTFVPDRRETADEYPLPELDDTPRTIFPDAASLMQTLENQPTEGYALYWDRDRDGDPHQAMLIFTEDGGMIAGLASTRPDAGSLLRKLAAVVHGSFGLVVVEERPPETMALFADMCRSSRGPRMVAGKILDIVSGTGSSNK